MRSSSVQAEAKPALEIPVGMLREPDLVTTPEVAQLERPRYTA